MGGTVLRTIAIILTASRSLVDTSKGATDKSRAWYREQFKEHVADKFSNINTLDNILITGDASSDKFGCDCLDWRNEEEVMPEIVVYQLDGIVKTRQKRLYGNDIIELRRWALSEQLNGVPNHVVPLKRNEAMIASAPAESICIGFIAPWAKKHGTEHTLALAEKRGLKTKRFVCPVEYKG